MRCPPTDALPVPDLVPRLHPVASPADDLQRLDELHAVPPLELIGGVDGAEVDGDGRRLRRHIRLGPVPRQQRPLPAPLPHLPRPAPPGASRRVPGRAPRSPPPPPPLAP